MRTRMPPITNSDLQAIAKQITDATRHEVTTLRNEMLRVERGICDRVDELKAKQAEQNGRVNQHATALAELRAEQDVQCERLERCESDCGDHGQELARLDERTHRVDERTRNVSPRTGLVLTKKQKAFLL